MSSVMLWQGELPPLNEREALRYAGAKEATPEVLELLKECAQRCQWLLAPRVCYARYHIKRTPNGLDLGFAQTDSAALMRNLNGCDEIIVFAATLGLELDRQIARYAHLSPARSMMLQAIGTERIESLCDAFENDLISQGLGLRPRFSPGYGDLPLEMQRELIAALDCAKTVGISLNESLMMSPSKSVTAIIGLTAEKGERCVHNCAMCELEQCLYRR